MRRPASSTALYLLAVAALVAGCSHQDLSRPVIGSVTDIVDSGKPYVKDDRAAELERAKRIAKLLANWKTESDASRAYHIGANDVLEVGILSLEEPGKMSMLLRTVADQGGIDVPWVGLVPIAGLTALEARDKVVDALAGRYIKNPEVTLKVAKHRSAQIILTGAVKSPGAYYLSADRRTLLELLAEADGLAADAGNELLVIRGSTASGSQTQSDVDAAVATNATPLVVVDLKQLLDTGDLRQNIWIRGGDIITVPPRSSQYIYVLGYVNRAGAFEVRGEPPGTLQAVAMAGGLTGTARAENSWLLRKTPVGQKMIPLDLTKIARGTRPEVRLQAGDTLFVGSSVLARLSEFVKPSVGAGVSYMPGP